MNTSVWRRPAVLSAFGTLLILVALAFVLSRTSWSTTVVTGTAAVDGKTGGEATIVFVGDMMFDRYIRTVSERNGGDYLFSCVGTIFKNADLVVGNLEGPITAASSTSQGSVPGSAQNFSFTFPPTTAELLYRNNITLVSLGNNHIENKGAEGITSTRRYLGRAGVSYFGGLAGDEPVYRTTIDGIPLSFVSFNQFGGDPIEVVARRVEEEDQKERVVIVYTHWGDEYVPPTPQVRAYAKTLAQSGAHLIIGAHPHVVQEDELIGATPVYYSLGNFIFDQYWTPEVQTGLVLVVRISGDGEVRVEKRTADLLRDGRTCVR